MRKWCSQIVWRMGKSWNDIGWVLFLGTTFVPYIAGDLTIVVWPPFILLLISWWIVDVTDQDIPLWMILVGILMLAIGPFTHAGASIIACWVIYQFKVRQIE